MTALVNKNNRLNDQFAVAGWNENTISCLKALIKAGFKPAVVFMPRGFKCDRLQDLCEAEGLSWIYKAKGEDLHQDGLRLLVCASWPFLMSQKNLKKYELGALNVHASDLPKYRGRHPINWAILNDEREIGVSVHFVDAGIDTGDIVAKGKFKIGDNDDLVQIRERAHELGGELLVKVYKELKTGKLNRIKQASALATQAPKRKPEDGLIDWSKPAREIFLLVRASSRPGPGAFTHSGRNKLTVWKVRLIKRTGSNAAAGEVIKHLKNGFVVRTGNSSDDVMVAEYDGVPPKKGEILK